MYNAQHKTQNRGQAVLIAVILLTGAMLVAVGGFTALSLGQEGVVRTNLRGMQGFLLAEAGQEDAVYRLMTGRAVSDEEVLVLAGGSATTTITDTDTGKGVSARGDAVGNIRTVETSLSDADKISFHYGVQVGEGGLEMRNSSSVSGNVYANGPVEGSGNTIRGSVVSAGPDGVIDDIYATSSAYANTIRDSEIDGDAYYQTITNTIVHGEEFPGSEDKPTSTLSISDEQIEKWKTAAEDGGVISCNDGDEHEIDDDTTLGPVKIPCDLDVRSSPTVTLEGPVWVTGDITVRNQAVIKVASSLGEKSVAMVADDPDDDDELIRTRNQSSFQGSGDDNSYVLLVSQNTEAESGEGDAAIEIDNQSDAGDLLVFAGHGLVVIKNKTAIREVSGYAVRTENQAEVEYESGFASALFETGPAGGYAIVEWKEVE